jgi:DNA primase catalytic subunit
MTHHVSVECGQSARLARARRYFIESYLRLHDFGPVNCRDEGTSVVFSMTTEGRACSLRVSEAWLMASTHARVEERLDRLQTCRKMREHGAVYLDVTRAGQDVLCPSM